MNHFAKLPRPSIRMMILIGIILAFSSAAALLIREFLDQEDGIHAAMQSLPLSSPTTVSDPTLVSLSPSGVNPDPSCSQSSSLSSRAPVTFEVSRAGAASAPSDNGEQPEDAAPDPLPAPAVYADPAKLGEVTEHDEEMYNRVVTQFAEKMGSVTASPDSEEYREQFRKAGEEAENTMRALMGHDAFIKMQAASERGETVGAGQ